MKAVQTLKKNREFQETFQKGRAFSNSSFVLYVCPLPEAKGQLKVAFCVGKKLGSAVRRNRLKRQMRSVFMDLNEKVKTDFNLILIARGKAGELNYTQLKMGIHRLFVKAGLLCR
jgi:ribonuclease P protein component